MHTIKQPVLGLLSTLLVIAIAMGIISLFDEQVFGTWVSFLFMACVPTQIVCGLVWQCEYPGFTRQLSQPAKGLTFLGISILGGAIFAPIMLYTVGGGVAPLPQLMMYTILTIVVAFWIVGVWQAWPVSAVTDNPVLIGIGVLLICYVGAYLLFNTLFDFSFLAGAPIYVEALDPKGSFMAWKVMAFLVTTVAVIMFCILCDFWPVSLNKAAQESTVVFGLLATFWILLTASVIFYICTSILKLDYVVYMVRGPVAFIFGAFIILNLMQNSLFAGLTSQPARGITLAVVCLLLAAVMQLLYQTVGPLVSGPLNSGLPTYQLELWLANAMLAITFPLIVFFTDFLQLWPLRADDSAIEST